MSDDCILLFRKFDKSNEAVLVFWATLYSLLDMSLNKKEKIATITFYNEEDVSP